MPIDVNTQQWVEPKKPAASPNWLYTPEGDINPNLINLVAGIGAGMDPQGAAGVIGRGAIEYNTNVAAQKAYKEQQTSEQGRNKKIFDVLSSWGDMSPKGEMGPTKVEMKPDGQVSMVGDITQTNIPIADKQTSNVQPTPETIPAGQRITNDNQRYMDVGAALSGGPSKKVAPVPVPQVRQASTSVPLATPTTQAQPEAMPAVTAAAPAPTVVASAAPVSARRSQTMYDLRNILPF